MHAPPVCSTAHKVAQSLCSHTQYQTKLPTWHRSRRRAAQSLAAPQLASASGWQGAWAPKQRGCCGCSAAARRRAGSEGEDSVFGSAQPPAEGDAGTGFNEDEYVTDVTGVTACCPAAAVALQVCGKDAWCRCHTSNASLVQTQKLCFFVILCSYTRAGAVQLGAVEDGANTRPKRRGRPSKADAAAKGQLVGEIYDEADLQPGENVAPAVATDRGSDDNLLPTVRCQASVRIWEACWQRARARELFF